MQQRFRSRLRPVPVYKVGGAVCFFIPLSVLGVLIWHLFLTEGFSDTWVWEWDQPSRALLQCYVIIRAMTSATLPPLVLLVWVPMLVPGWYGVTLTDDLLRVRRLARIRTIPRADVMFIGLWVQGCWPPSGPDPVVWPSNLYRPDGRPLPIMRLMVVYRNRRRYWPGRLRRLSLHPLFTGQEMNAMQGWAARKALASD